MTPVRSYSDVLKRTKEQKPPEDVSGWCRVWSGRTVRGQARLVIDGKDVAVRRWVFEQTHGYLPAVVGAKCGNPMCCSRKHLIPLTRSDVKRHSPSPEVRRRAAMAGGLSAAHIVLDLEKARAIRADSRPTAEVAADYGVKPITVRKVKAGKAWREPPSALSVMAAALGVLAA